MKVSRPGPGFFVHQPAGYWGRLLTARPRSLAIVVALALAFGAVAEAEAGAAQHVAAKTMRSVAAGRSSRSVHAKPAPADVTGPVADAKTTPLEGVRLVLQITIDQMRADLLLRDRDRWSAGGLRRLYDQGAVFLDANHAHANTETIVGHATLATGADPSVHGLVANAWFDRASGKLRHNIEDEHFEAVDSGGAAAAGTGNASDVAAGPRTSCSPAGMQAPTLADSIATAGGGRAKVYALSLKDRGAVPMAGRAGKALWWSEASGRFESSTYYFPDRRLPSWALAWNAAREADSIDGRSWSLLLDASAYKEAGADDRSWEQPPPGMGRTFPHVFDRRASGAAFYETVAASPFGDEMLLGLARRALASGELGSDDVVDYLSISLSSSDSIGHRYGPSSLEVEDEVMRLDRVIAGLLEAADRAAGADHVVVVLSSDHGVAEVPEELEAGHRPGGRIRLSEIEASPAVANLAASVGGKLILATTSPYLYLDVAALRTHRIDPAMAGRELAAVIAKTPGIEAAFTRWQIEGRGLPDTAAARAVRRNFHATRSGDIDVVVKPGWQITYESGDAQRFATGHGSPWPYDTHVPLVFVGPGIAHVVVSRRVETVDVAPTLAALIGVARPALATGRVLAEVRH